jgi:hypothetical protein
MLFTNSTEQLRAALDRSVDKEMAVEALRESNHRSAVSVEERERLVGTVNDTAPEQSFDQGSMSNSSEDTRGDDGPLQRKLNLNLIRDESLQTLRLYFDGLENSRVG